MLFSLNPGLTRESWANSGLPLDSKTRHKTKTMPRTRLRPWLCDYVITDLAVADLSVIVRKRREDIKEHRTLLGRRVCLLVILVSEEHVVGECPMHVYINPSTITYLNQRRYFLFHIFCFFLNFNVSGLGHRKA